MKGVKPVRMKKNETIEKLDKVVEYVEENINYDISLDDIAAYSGLSKFYLHKIFKVSTNEKLMAYVRNRKLVHSINDLLNTDLRIIDIAQNYSFDYEQSYIRSFINTFGLSPDKFRKEKPTVRIVDKINWDNLTPIDEKNVIYQPITVIKSSFYVAGIKHIVKVDENMKNCFTTEAGNDFFNNHLHKITNIKKPCSYIGLIFLCCLFIPNIFYGLYPPIDYFKIKENKILSFMERIGQVLCTILVIIFDDFNIHKISFWTIWLGIAFILMVLYLLCWVRYFLGNHLSKDFYRPFLGIPVPLAVLPVIAVFLLSVYGKVILLGIAAIILGIGHIGITTHNWNELKNSVKA
jgi:AraC-like DNA-binding protein